MPVFTDYPLRIVSPLFESPLTSVVIALEYLRRLQLGGTTPAPIFFQLKGVFHLLESLGSARIEGNRTTLAEAVDSKIEPQKNQSEQIREIANMEQALEFVDRTMSGGQKITKAFVLELHKLTVTGLSKEGDRTPGSFRTENVTIAGSSHKPPDYLQVEPYIDELLLFINEANDSKYDLLKVALFHHRFAWIHPFRNGNGRVVRLLTYTMMVQRGFNVHHGRLLNPSAIFCIDRDRYYSKLSAADAGTDEALLGWCEYVLEGIHDELKKIDKLLDYEFLRERIFKPALNYSIERKLVTDLEGEILRVAIEKKIFQVSDIEHLMPKKLPQERSRVLAKMRKAGLIEPVEEKARRYVLGFRRSYLIRGIIDALQKENFIPSAL